MVLSLHILPRKNSLTPLLLACACLCLLGLGAVARADQLHLKDGRMIEADEVWETGGDVWYRQGKVINYVARADVLRITRNRPAEGPETKPDAKAPAKPQTVSRVMDFPATSNAGAGAAKPASAAANEAADETANETKAAAKTVARILLKGGVKIDADAVWEEPTRVGYRLGKMQTFVDREAVASVIYEVIEAPPAPDKPLPQLRFTTGHRGLDQLIVENARKHSVDPLLIYLVMRQESGFNHQAVSRAGARGLMQLMPETARKLGVRNIHNPVENLEAGTRYLKYLIRLFNGDVNLALAAYNAGENAVLRYGYRVPPYRETRNYVYSINMAYRRAMALQAAADSQK